MELDEMDPALVAELREMGGRWGPMGVALAAAELAGKRAVFDQLLDNRIEEVHEARSRAGEPEAPALDEAVGR